MLVNEPSMLKDQAPTFWKSFLSYLDRKPEVKGLYDEIQDRMGNRAAVTENRLENIYGMLERGNEARQSLNERNAPKPEDLKDSVMRWLVDKQHAALKVIRRQEKLGGDKASQASKARYDLEEMNYLASEAENYIHEIGSRLLKPMEQAGLTAEDMGAYLFLERARQERTEIANPLGHTAETATETLQGLKARLGEQKFARLEELTSGLPEPAGRSDPSQAGSLADVQARADEPDQEQQGLCAFQCPEAPGRGLRIGNHGEDLQADWNAFRDRKPIGGDGAAGHLHAAGRQDQRSEDFADGRASE